MGGHIHAITCSPAEVLSGVNAGDLKILAILGEKEALFFPDVPTGGRVRYNVNVMAWGGLGLYLKELL